MSRIGRRPIKVPQSVKIQVDENQILVTGPKGKQQASLHEKLQLEQKDDEIKILADYKEDTIARTQMGTLYSLLNNDHRSQYGLSEATSPSWCRLQSCDQWENA